MSCIRTVGGRYYRWHNTSLVYRCERSLLSLIRMLLWAKIIMIIHTDVSLLGSWCNCFQWGNTISTSPPYRRGENGRVKTLKKREGKNGRIKTVKNDRVKTLKKREGKSDRVKTLQKREGKNDRVKTLKKREGKNDTVKTLKKREGNIDRVITWG